MLQGAMIIETKTRKQQNNVKLRYYRSGSSGIWYLSIMYILNQSKNIAAGIQLVFNILKPLPVWCVDCLSAGTDL